MTDNDKKEINQIVSKIITDAFMHFWEQISPILATKEDVSSLDTKVDSLDKKVDVLDKKVTTLSRDVKEIRGRLIDVEVDTPTRSEFNRLKAKVDKLKN